VSGSPEKAYPAAPKQASLLTDKRRDGHHVIRIGGVLQAKNEA
jgi:hypothetical protein